MLHSLNPTKRFERSKNHAVSLFITSQASKHFLHESRSLADSSTQFALKDDPGEDPLRPLRRLLQPPLHHPFRGRLRT